MNGQAVSNTGPLLALSVVARLDILRHLFQQVCVPESVHREILAGGANNAGLATYLQADWISVEAVAGQIDPLLAGVLHQGEAAVIHLALQRPQSTVVIDERKARKIARELYGLRVIGTAGLLVEAKRRGLVASVGDVLNEMRGSGYWIHEDIVRYAVRSAGEA